MTDVDREFDPAVDMGVFFVHSLREMASAGDAPADLKKDWSVIERWLRCVDRPLSKNDDAKIRRAWQAYLATGIAPSRRLQSLFSSTATHDIGAAQVDMPPQSVIDVFNRMLAIDAEIRRSKVSSRVPAHTAARAAVVSSGFKTRFLSRNKRILISALVAWTTWVVFRTSGDYEFLGIELYSWDDDMFALNLILPPVAAVALFLLYKWIQGANK